MTRHLPASLLTPFLLLGAATVWAQPQDPLNPFWTEVRAKNWANAAQQLETAEKEGFCKEAVCLALHAILSDRSGEGPQAVAYARRAAAMFGPDSGLNAGHCNDLGVIFYQRAKGDRELLKLAEAAFRQASSAYKGDASNIRFNLAKTLEALGRGKEAKAIMTALEKEGLLISPGMAILGDFQNVVLK